MNKFDSSHLKKEIYIIFFSFLILTIITLSMFSYSINALAYLHNTTENIYKHPLKVSNASLNIKLNIEKLNAGMAELHLLKKWEQNNIFANIQECETATKDFFKIIQKNILGEEGKALYNRTKVIYDEGKKLRDEVISLIQKQNINENYYHAKNKEIAYMNKVKIKTDELYNYAHLRASEFQRESNTAFEKKEKNLTIFTVAVIFIFLLIALYLSRRNYLYHNILRKHNKDLNHSNETLRASQKLANMGSWVNNHSKDELIWSPRIFDMFGINKDDFEVTYENFIGLVHVDDKQRVLDEYRNSLENKLPYWVEHRILKGDGNICYVIESANHIYNNAGKVVESRGIIIDVTKQKLTELENAKNLNISSSLFNSLEISIWNEDFSNVYRSMEQLRASGVSDLKQYLCDNPEYLMEVLSYVKVTDVNAASLKMFNAQDEKQLIENITTTFGENALSVFENELLAIWNKDDFFRQEANFITLDKIEKRGIISFLIPKKEEDFKNILVSILDVTEIKEKDDLILLQSRHAAMGEMISMIAHQWRQPITTISMSVNNQILDLDLNNFNKEETLSYCNNILTQTEYLSKTIDDFRNFFQVDEEKSLVTFAEVVEDVLSLIQSSYKNNSIEITTDIKSEVLLNVKKRELEQVIINILNNAKDALTINEIVNARVHIFTSENGKYNKLNILDNGKGVKKEIMHKIFEPYFTTKNKQNGSGLGLYMSKIIIEEHMNGKLSMVNKEEGACFSIRFPKETNPKLR